MDNGVLLDNGVDSMSNECERKSIPIANIVTETLSSSITTSSDGYKNITISQDELGIGNSKSIPGEEFKLNVNACMKRYILDINNNNSDKLFGDLYDDSDILKEESSDKHETQLIRLLFPSTLSINQRKTVHDCAMSNGLKSKSVGVVPNRYITVSSTIFNSYEDTKQF